MSSLQAYRSKRKAGATPEPMPAASAPLASSTTGLSFVIQEHHASALHWDLRLERDGVLVSWAVPKGIPMDPQRNHLAVRTEDHPLEYLTFSGTIPAGQYGAGTMTIWDHGEYECEKWSDSEVKVVLRGERVAGRYVLFQTNDDQWMLHRMDPPPPDWQKMPQDLAPMLATAGELPTGSDWSYELKWDGVRALCFIEGGRIRLVSRNGKDITRSYPELGALGKELGSRAVVLDGEIVALDELGRPSFSALQPRMHVVDASKARRMAGSVPVHYFVFDVLHLDGKDLLGCPYADRREVLESLTLVGEAWRVPPSFAVDGAAVLAASKESGLEGVIAKRGPSKYRPGKRSPDWIKVKHTRTQEVVIGGYSAGRGTRTDSMGALLIGVPDGSGGLDYVGKVGSGFDAVGLREAVEALQALTQAESPFNAGVPKAESATATWVRPDLVGEVEFTEWTKDGKLRHPTWRGWRPDKVALDVGREGPDPDEERS